MSKTEEQVDKLLSIKKELDILFESADSELKRALIMVQGEFANPMRILLERFKREGRIFLEKIQDENNV